MLFVARLRPPSGSSPHCNFRSRAAPLPLLLRRPFLSVHLVTPPTKQATKHHCRSGTMPCDDVDDVASIYACLLFDLCSLKEEKREEKKKTSTRNTSSMSSVLALLYFCVKSCHYFYRLKRGGKDSMLSQSDGTKPMHRGMTAALMAITRLVNSSFLSKFAVFCRSLCRNCRSG